MSVTPGLTMSLLPLASLWLCYPRSHYGSVTPSLTMTLLPLHGFTMALLPLASLYGSVTSSLTMSLLPLASLWLCYPRPHYVCYPWPHYVSVTPGLTMALLSLHGFTMALLPLASLCLCYPWPHYGSVTPGLTTALLPLASLYGSVTSGLTMSLLPLASLWLCYPRSHYGSVIPQASLWLFTPAWPHYCHRKNGIPEKFAPPYHFSYEFWHPHSNFPRKLSIPLGKLA